MSPPSAEALARASQALAGGKLVAFPTETVYGLGGDAGNDQAVADIFAAKGRPSFNPLIVHLPDVEAVERYAVMDERARQMADLYWPGPLTLVLPRRPDAALSLLVSAGLDTVAVRVPRHPTARALLQASGRPIAAPSANRSGHVSPTAPIHVREEFPDGGGGRLALILADGRCPVGVESTVLDLSGEHPVLLRPGSITPEEIEAVLGPIQRATTPGAGAPHAGLKAPGMLESHYAPGLPVRLNALNAAKDEALLGFGPDRFVLGGAERLNLSPTGDLNEAAANLFAMLRRLDKPGLCGIAVMTIPDVGLGLAINDRLRRAAAPRP
ncbi:L-threonylcarbamoyladenylate synthase [Nitrospirillum sp. BR 11164]|uniref:L-threonylcarbamoyladenylate synthase n=1 Tax=Nitrospirillum sp. BR 11164 TaxID=3104324 RepID=UPI002AFF0223|nr:L-threonylcarbamoyladenylate synthase [Nitrospirillum sp. BR 11164]MEA1652942.1 L-threonylcarbamoyladenylate synthase [Nitrospirillum sp. BR 11164]